MIFLPVIIVAGSLMLGKGVSDPWNDCLRIDALSVEWFYDWSTQDTEGCDTEFIPMIWSVEKGQQVLDGSLKIDDSRYVIFLNEPNASSQANDTPQEAADSLKELQAKLPNRKWIVGNLHRCEFNPSDCLKSEFEWMSEFLSLCDCQIDIIGIHYYEWYQCDTDRLKKYIERYRQYGYPLLVSEYGCLHPNEDYRINSMLKWQDEFSGLEGYAPFTTYWPWAPFDINSLFNQNSLTRWGASFESY